MKKLFLLFTGLCFVFVNNAQITITSNEIVDVGDIIFESTDTIPNNSVISPGGTGNQTWDFSSLEEHDTDSTYLLNADETPYYLVFPTSNIAAYTLPDSMYSYITKNETGMFQNGFVGDIFNNGETDTFIYIMPELIIATPVNYNDMVLNTSKIEIFFSSTMKIIQTVFSKDTIDAYGDITIPAGTFSSLRKFRTSIQIDSMFTYSSGNWNFMNESVDTTYDYEWMTDDPAAKFFLCSFEYDIDADTITDKISHLKELRSSDTDKISGLRTGLIYPNPGKGIYTVKSSIKKINSVEIIDYTGRIIDVFIPKNNVFKIDISDKPQGLYLIRINSDEKDEIIKVISNP